MEAYLSQNNQKRDPRVAEEEKRKMNRNFRCPVNAMYTTPSDDPFIFAVGIGIAVSFLLWAPFVAVFAVIVDIHRHFFRPHPPGVW